MLCLKIMALPILSSIAGGMSQSFMGGMMSIGNTFAKGDVDTRNLHTQYENSRKLMNQQQGLSADLFRTQKEIEFDYRKKNLELQKQTFAQAGLPPELAFTNGLTNRVFNGNGSFADVNSIGSTNVSPLGMRMGFFNPFRNGNV